MNAVVKAKNRVKAGYTALEEWLHAVTHGLGAALALAGTVVLIVMASLSPQVDVWKLVSFSVYGLSMVMLYLASTLYHGARDPGRKQLFKLLDHCAIFLLIAGTYTPFLLVNMRGTTGWVLFAIVWTLALGGITLKLVFGHRFKPLQLSIYLLMGWMIVFASSELVEKLNATGLSLVIAGGVTYTLGVVFYLVRQIPYNHAIWHLFVLGGSACHFFAVYYGVLPVTMQG